MCNKYTNEFCGQHNDLGKPKGLYLSNEKNIDIE